MNKPSGNAAILLDELATIFFGDEWAGPLSEFCKINHRTLQRIRKAARNGEDHSSARGVIAALADASAEFQAQLETVRQTTEKS